MSSRHDRHGGDGGAVDEPEATVDVPSFQDMSLEHLLEAFSDATPAPGGGGAAVLAVALSASLCAMTARLSSRHMPRASEVATEALSIRDTIAPLCEEDARTYLDVIAAIRSSPEPDPAERRRRIADALSAATDVPMATVEAGARLAHLAADLVQDGNPNLRADALVAAVLAGAGVEAAGTLARINLAELPDDDRHATVRTLTGQSSESVHRARLAAVAVTG
jgi:formiminotetrahydrofolate cyclodeaminase